MSCKALYPYATLQDFIQAGCLSSQGNCAFCTYAQTPDSQAPSYPYPAGQGICNQTSCAVAKLDLPKDVRHNGVATCFPNYKDADDRLCIFTDYVSGNSNVEHMDPSTRASKLKDLITSAQPPAGSNLCLHTKEAASVAWTHMHIFDDADKARGGPEGMCANRNAYCTRYAGAGDEQRAADELHANASQSKLGCVAT